MMKFLKVFISKFCQRIKVSTQTDDGNAYFVRAKSWADDIYTETIAARNRYRFALLWSIGLISCLLVIIIILIPLEHTVLIVVHRSDSGAVWVEPLRQSYAPKNQAEIESEIVRYVVNRESYSASSYDEQYSLVNLLSSSDVAKQYVQGQSLSNKDSDVNRFGNRGTRTVHIENIIFLDNKVLNRSGRKNVKHHNLAQVDFTITDHDKLTEKTTERPFVALISWFYHGTPRDPESKWRNWSGFTVMRYTVEQRNV